MQIIAVVNEKGGTGKTTTSVSLSAALGSLGRRILLVDLDGQASASRWFGVEDDDRLADALAAGGGLEPIENVAPGVSLAPATGKVDSVARDLRPSQSAQLRKVLRQVRDRYDLVVMDCPPSLNNRLIGNALLAATHVLVPVETSIMALDGLQILLTTLEDISDAFEHQIVLAGVLACRYDARTRLSRLVLEELRRALPSKVFSTVIRENVRMRECPASGQSILEFAPGSHAAEDYLALAQEMLDNPVAWIEPADWETTHADDIEDEAQRCSVDSLRSRAAATVRAGNAKSSSSQTEKTDDEPQAAPVEALAGTPAPVQDSDPVLAAETCESIEIPEPTEAPQPEPEPAPVNRWTGGALPAEIFKTPEPPAETPAPVQDSDPVLAAETCESIEIPEPVEAPQPQPEPEPAPANRWTSGSLPPEIFQMSPPSSGETSADSTAPDYRPGPPVDANGLDSPLDRLAEARARLNASETDIEFECQASPAAEPKLPVSEQIFGSTPALSEPPAGPTEPVRPAWRTPDSTPEEPVELAASAVASKFESAQAFSVQTPEDTVPPTPPASEMVDENLSVESSEPEAVDKPDDTQKPKAGGAFPALRALLSQMGRSRKNAGDGSNKG